MTAVANQLAAALELLLERTDHPPAANCSCHLSPPCNDCVNWGGLREAISDAEAALAAHDQDERHPDDRAVDAFAIAMKLKLAEARDKGRGGWHDPAQCTAEDLSRMLREHVEKGDPRDVANFCMMLQQRGEAIVADAGNPTSQTEPMFYLQDRRQYVGNCPLWWAIGGAGYTTRIDQAQRYTRAEAYDQNRTRDTDVPWPCDQIDALVRPTIDYQDLRRIQREEVDNAR